MLKMCDNPPMLSATATSLAHLDGTWGVAHTKARAEKAFAWDLTGRGVNYFLPMREKVTVSTGRKRRVLVPMFASYVFFCGDEKDRYIAMTTGRLCGTIAVADQEGLVRELAAIERALTGEAVLDPYPHAVAGRPCRITAGAMAGMEGIVVERTPRARIVLQVSILGQAVCTEVDVDLIEPIDG
jgi:hypothetical protein